ncbi:amidohydrolase family protein [Endozoicomonas gorgoniicola]|uniref:Amidohydrolase family protein n=1 Tax=Endozoicomonas gorgoniicola TaxID=1234144 RepID=A0ABT3N1W8_9GAMM|nr:amidohydrolase family protein [Endozoicomonas gorgoniicola]MCW7555627.1 amidohydrolase family protein [Endozoicomonas gorgoniicola]
MKILRYFLVSVVAAFLLVLATSIYFWFYLNPTPVGKQLFVNGVILTMDDYDTIADAVLVERDRIVATGTEDSLKKQADDAHIIDLEGKALIPGFIDIHGHFFSSKMNISFADGLDILSLNVEKYLVRGVTSVRAALPRQVENKPLELLSQIGVIPQRVFIQKNSKSYTSTLVEPLKTISDSIVPSEIAPSEIAPPETALNEEPDKYDQSQRIMLLLRRFTIDAARELDVDRKTGSIEAGKLADFLVLSDNPLTHQSSLGQIHVDQTWIGGVQRFNRHRFSEDDDRLPASQP